MPVLLRLRLARVIVHRYLRLLLILPMLGLPGTLAAQVVPAVETAEVVFERVATSSGNVFSAQDIAVRMRDGVTLSLDIYRPPNNDEYPTLYAAGPYPHSQSILGDDTSDVGPVAWYVSQGYAVVLASVRGTGLSGGEYAFLGREEQQDHYEVIEWIRGQPWSNGRIAGTGAGYYATSQWLMAIQNPPGLTCIAPINGVLDPLRESITPGGLANDTFINGWYDRQVRLANAYDADAPRLVTFDLRLAQLSHPWYDEFWAIRSSLESIPQINVPVFALNQWSLAPEAPGVTGTLAALARLNSINKILISNPSEGLPLQQDTGFLARELLPYYDWCLNGFDLDSPYIEKPRFRYQVRGQSTIKPDSIWPPGNTAHQGWYLNDPSQAGGLAMEQDTSGTGFSTWNRNSAGTGLRFVSAPLGQDLEISGPVMLELYASSSATDMAFEVSLYEELVYRPLPADPQLPGFLGQTAIQEESPGEGSTFITVTRGAMKASARARDVDRSSDYLPVYALEAEQPLGPGQIVRLDIALRQTAYRFAAGSRIVVEITPANDGSLRDAGARDVLRHNSQYPTRLWLPAVRPLLSTRQPATDLSLPPALPTGETGNGFELPEFDFLDPEAINAIDGDAVENPVIFIPR